MIKRKMSDNINYPGCTRIIPVFEDGEYWLLFLGVYEDWLPRSVYRKWTYVP